MFDHRFNTSMCIYTFPIHTVNFFPLSSAASNVGSHRRQISDLLDQSIQISLQCFIITADNRFILLCGFWDKSFRVYSTDSGTVQSLYTSSPLALIGSGSQKAVLFSAVF